MLKIALIFESFDAVWSSNGILWIFFSNVDWRSHKKKIVLFGEILAIFFGSIFFGKFFGFQVLLNFFLFFLWFLRLYCVPFIFILSFFGFFEVFFGISKKTKIKIFLEKILN